jgi:Fe-S-cluster containining protein
MSSTRRELGMARTAVCDCPVCVGNCKERPGYMIVQDVDRIWKTVAPQMSRSEFILTYVEPGTGFTTMNEDMKFIKTQTIRPKKIPGHGCIFLKDNRCSIHEVSPFGCAFFKCGMPRAEADEKNHTAIRHILGDIQAGGLYYLIMERLLGVKKHQIVEDVTKRLFPRGVPPEYKQIAAMLKERRLAGQQNPRKPY